MSMNNPSSTPAGYMTPEQIQQMYHYSGNLTAGGMRDKEITSPWQGVRMMADALAGRSMRNQAGQQQKGGINDYTQRLEQSPGSPMGGGNIPSTPPPAQGTPTPPQSIQPQPTRPPMMPNSAGSPMQGQNPMLAALMTQPPAMG